MTIDKSIKTDDEQIAKGFKALEMINEKLTSTSIDNFERMNIMRNKDFIVQHLFRLNVPLVKLMKFM
jgi:hypothetical protein